VSWPTGIRWPTAVSGVPDVASGVDGKGETVLEYSIRVKGEVHLIFRDNTE